ncbi:hypothetical protein Tco_0027452 [Tanacetum coccineum]
MTSHTHHNTQVNQATHSPSPNIEEVYVLISLEEAWRSVSNFFILFDFKSKKLGEVCLPERLVHTPLLNLAKVNESLGLLEYYDECEMSVYGVWMRKYGANKKFSKIYTVKVEGKSLNGVLAFRNNGEVVMELKNDDNYDESRIEVSGHTNGVEINGETDCFSMWSYMETLLLLDDSESVIYY